MAKKLALAIVSLLLAIFSLPGVSQAQELPEIQIASQDWYVGNDSEWKVSLAATGLPEDSTINSTIWGFEADGTRVPLHRFTDIEISEAGSTGASETLDWSLQLRAPGTSSPGSTLIPSPGRYIVSFELIASLDENPATTIASTETAMNVVENDLAPLQTLVVLVDETNLSRVLEVIASSDTPLTVGLDLSAIGALATDQELAAGAVAALNSRPVFSFSSAQLNPDRLAASSLFTSVEQGFDVSNQWLVENGFQVLDAPAADVLELARALDIETLDTSIATAATLLSGNSSHVVVPVVETVDPQTQDLLSDAILLLTASGPTFSRQLDLPERVVTGESATTLYNNPEMAKESFELAMSFVSSGPEAAGAGFVYLDRAVNLVGSTNPTPLSASLVSEIEADLEQVRVVTGQPLNVASTEAELPITIINSSDTSREVILNLDSEKATIADSQKLITAEPGTNSENVRVELRSLGQTEIDIQLMTPDGQQLISEGSLSVRSTAFPGMGMLLSAAALISLLLWWVWTARSESATVDLSDAEFQADASEGLDIEPEIDADVPEHKDPYNREQVLSAGNLNESAGNS